MAMDIAIKGEISIEIEINVIISAIIKQYANEPSLRLKQQFEISLAGLAAKHRELEDVIDLLDT